MRNQRLSGGSLGLVLAMWLTATPSQAIFGVCLDDWFGGECCCPQKYCCDDYCPKPLPCPPRADCCRLCDNYCHKPLPCPPCVDCRRFCDDYCPKPLPCLRCRSTEHDVCIPYRIGYQCGEASGCVSGDCAASIDGK
ncbi:hypothetical protein [Botrimarina mediterranea]|uniref:4Fe-4S ferredoxin-type domain-containing protein n=1 Tax=Botrimarina mediterranea TaxID=2528022 RepID=A0A518KAJ0_9BACT|nr:hypothetical protein [Botrimarina mediterranea]QDV74805.1 hypothetical protein Spa11_30140 [Botrimarina mediterranea]QDV79449.1 hypothetical protein K2D_30640 [Planctomycetes bacterium K2D]